MNPPPELEVAPPRPEIVTGEIPTPRAAWIERFSGTDHKNVGVLMLSAALSFLVLAIAEFVLMRIQLIVPDNTMIEPAVFDRLLSSFGATSIVLFALPLVLGLALYLVPLQIGARGVAFPRLGALSVWLYVGGGIAIYASYLFNPPDAGVNPLPPLSEAAFSDTAGVDAWILGVGLAVLGFLLAAINLVVTVHGHRAPGLAWRRTPLFSWASTVSAYLVLVAGPVMLAALTMLFIDRHFDGVFFEPTEGGAPVLWQHLSWFFFTACYLIAVLFVSGVVSEILPVFARKPQFSHRGAAAALVAIGLIGPFAWIQNMYSAPIPKGWEYMAMAAALALAVPLGLLFVNWIGTIWRGALRFGAPMLFALGAVSTISFGLAGELASSVIPVGWQMGSTTTAQGDTIYVLVGALGFGGFAALHYWFPKITGRAMGEGLGRASFWTMLIGVHLTVLPLQLAGLEGQPVDVYQYYEGTGVSTYNLIASLGSFVLAGGFLMALGNAAWSARHGLPSSPDPWEGETLEWYALSPPPPHNFDVLPDVRSTEPLREIRGAVRSRSEVFGGAATAPSAERAAVAAEPAASEGEPAEASAEGEAQPSGDEGDTPERPAG